MNRWLLVAALTALALYQFRHEAGTVILDTIDGSPGGEVDTLARTIWGEARGEGYAGMEAVASVVMNRFKVSRAKGKFWWGNTVKEICLKPWQFSCWNPTDANSRRVRQVTEADSAFRQALEIAQRAVAGQLVDRTRGATHYYAYKVISAPSWARELTLTAQIGGHKFYV